MRGRLVQLFLGLALYGLSSSLLVLARLGLDPWDVFHQGLARHSGLAIGTWSILVGLVVLLLWIPLRQLPGIGTVANVVLIGGTMDIVLSLVHSPNSLLWRIVCLLAGVGLNGVATGAYIGAGLGPGPRDGLMTGLAARGHSIRVVRTGIEIAVLVTGWLLGGTVGVGTVLYAVSIGPLAHVFVPVFSRGRPVAARGASPPRDPVRSGWRSRSQRRGLRAEPSCSPRRGCRRSTRARAARSVATGSWSGRSRPSFASAGSPPPNARCNERRRALPPLRRSLRRDERRAALRARPRAGRHGRHARDRVDGARRRARVGGGGGAGAWNPRERGVAVRARGAAAAGCGAALRHPRDPRDRLLARVDGVRYGAARVGRDRARVPRRARECAAPHRRGAHRRRHG